jgi:hypothetical protein
MRLSAPPRRNDRIHPKATIGRSACSRCAAILVLVLLALPACSVIRGGPAPIDRSGDPAIVSSIQARLAAEPELDADLLRVESNGGVVTLYGTVRGLGQWNCALRNASLVAGVVSVIDYLIIERGPREIPCAAPRGSD